MKVPLVKNCLSFLSSFYVFSIKRILLLWKLNVLIIFVIAYFLLQKPKDIKKEDVIIHTAVVISSTYYNVSSLYKNDTVVVHFNSYKNISTNLTWYCISKNITNHKIMSPLYPQKPYFQERLPCKMQTFASNCTTVSNPSYFALTSEINSTEVELHLRNAVAEDLPVVSCVSPLFFNEGWEINMLSIETYAYFGVNRQIYFYMSVIEKVFLLLKEYEKLKMINLHPWIVPNVSEMRTELEFRNQATSHNDCFLLYREAADFIIVHDPDDILIIKNITNFWQTFARLHFNMPHTGAFEFSRVHTKVKFAKRLKNFLLSNSLESFQSTNKSVWFKSVYHTHGIETVDSHGAVYLHQAFKKGIVEKEIGLFYHIRNVTYNGDTVGNKTNFFIPHQNTIIDKKHINNIKNIFSQRLQNFLNIKHLQNLSHFNYYYHQVDACYEKVYYKIVGNQYPCPNHYQCFFPEIQGLHCVQARQKYTKSHSNNLIIFHSQKSPEDIVFKNGCRLD